MKELQSLLITSYLASSAICQAALIINETEDFPSSPVYGQETIGAFGLTVVNGSLPSYLSGTSSFPDIDFLSFGSWGCYNVSLTISNFNGIDGQIGTVEILETYVSYWYWDWPRSEVFIGDVIYAYEFSTNGVYELPNIPGGYFGFRITGPTDGLGNAGSADYSFKFTGTPEPSSFLLVTISVFCLLPTRKMLMRHRAAA